MCARLRRATWHAHHVWQKEVFLMLDGEGAQQKVFPIQFADTPDIPVYYVNSLNIRVGVEAFYLTLGTVMPPEVSSAEDFQALASLTAQPIFRCAIAPQVMNQIITLLTQQYTQWVANAEALARLTQQAEPSESENDAEETSDE